MKKLQRYACRSALGLAAMVVLLFAPVVTFAATPTTSSQTGPTAPTGADATTYHYNSTTGLWENDYYTWDPVTHQTTAKTATPYTYDPATKTWTASPSPASASTNAPATPSKSQATDVSGTTESALSNLASSGTGPAATDPSPVTSTSASSNATTAVTNAITSKATTGDATVSQNTTSGSATSGDADAAATSLNMLQSSFGLQGANITTFTDTINGNVVGDLLLDPSQLKGTPLPLGTTNPNNLVVHDVTNTTIHNDINLAARSGNAAVDSNTQAGNAISGNANAMANVVNLVNSMIGSGQSFIGNININGNLEGDILLPQNLQEQLLASNIPTATINTSQIANGSTLAQFANNQAINNTVSLAAQSGNATVADNTSAGNATSGNAATNLTVFNLTGRNVVGSNSLLVFVNVLGTWVGMIMNAPAGTTAAMIGGGLTQNTTLPASSTVNDGHNTVIDNNIHATAISGNAWVTNNTSAGNAISGNARAGANLLNVSGSHFSLANWFGILFINVFGSWHGSFGVNTPFGNPTSSVPDSTGATDGTPLVHVFQFVPTGTGGQTQAVPVKPTALFGTPTSEHPSGATGSNTRQATAVLGSSTPTSGGPSQQRPAKVVAASPANHFNIQLVLGAICLSATLLIIERLLYLRSVHHRRAIAHIISE